MLNRCCGLVMSTAFLAGLLSQVYVPWPDWHVYFVECSVFAGFLLLDGVQRRANLSITLAHALAACFVAPLAVARWYAQRPLLPGEWRKGGVDANFFTAFGVMTVVSTGISAACNFLNFGPDRGFELIINSGFAVAGTALVMAMMVRQERVFERGPKSISNSAEEVE